MTAAGSGHQHHGSKSEILCNKILYFGKCIQSQYRECIMSLNTIHDVLKYTCKLGLRFALAGRLGLLLPALCCHLRGVLPYSQPPFLWGLWLLSLLMRTIHLKHLAVLTAVPMFKTSLWKTSIKTFPVLWRFVSFFSRAKNVNLCWAMNSFRGAAKLMSTNLPFFLHIISKFVEVINVMRTIALTRWSANQSYKCAAFMWFSALLQSVLEGPYRLSGAANSCAHSGCDQQHITACMLWESALAVCVMGITSTSRG